MKPTIEKSKYQLKIEETYLNTNKNIAISAVPGSGKTTTLLNLLKVTPISKKVLFCAFNKSMAVELSTKVPDFVNASTIHSLAYKNLLRNVHSKFKLTEIKTWILGSKLFEDKFQDKKSMSAYLFMLSKLWDLYRQNLCTKIEQIAQIADEYGISMIGDELNDFRKLVEVLDKYNKNLKQKEFMIDFTDMLYLCYKEVSVDSYVKYDVIMADEFQDVNKLQYSI